MTKVLIISSSDDFHSNHIEKKLLGNGIPVIRLDTDKFAVDQVRATFRTSPTQGIISIREEHHVLEEISSVWYRRPGELTLDIRDPHQRAFAQTEGGELLKQLYFSLEHALWISKHSALETARRKFPQLRVASNCGMSVPKTVITNSPETVRAFFSEHKGRIIYKTLHAPVIKPTAGPELWGVPTTVITPEFLKNIDLIKHTGGIFQEYIEKAYEVRVTIIGNEVFAAKIDSQAEPSARIDWRDAVYYNLVKVSSYELPADIARKCKAVVEAYDLNFGAIDLVCQPDGSYVFLELNCNGQWLWIEDLTGQQLTAAMIRLLGKQA